MERNPVINREDLTYKEMVKHLKDAGGDFDTVTVIGCHITEIPKGGMVRDQKPKPGMEGEYNSLTRKIEELSTKWQTGNIICGKCGREHPTILGDKSAFIEQDELEHKRNDISDHFFVGFKTGYLVLTDCRLDMEDN